MCPSAIIFPLLSFSNSESRLGLDGNSVQRSVGNNFSRILRLRPLLATAETTPPVFYHFCRKACFGQTWHILTKSELFRPKKASYVQKKVLQFRQNAFIMAKMLLCRTKCFLWAEIISWYQFRWPNLPFYAKTIKSLSVAP